MIVFFIAVSLNENISDTMKLSSSVKKTFFILFSSKCYLAGMNDEFWKIKEMKYTKHVLLSGKT